jgi:hypothetical protein
MFEGIGLDRLSQTAFFTPYDRVSRVRLTSLKSALSKAAQAGKSGGGRSSYVVLPREASRFWRTSRMTDLTASIRRNGLTLSTSAVDVS